MHALKPVLAHGATLDSSQCPVILVRGFCWRGGDFLFSFSMSCRATFLASPIFIQVGDIPDATECIALVFAVNEKGRSEPSRVIVQAISPPSKLLTSGTYVHSRRNKRKQRNARERRRNV